jgi:hypothetical protein
LILQKILPFLLIVKLLASLWAQLMEFAKQCARQEHALASLLASTPHLQAQICTCLIGKKEKFAEFFFRFSGSG